MENLKLKAKPETEDFRGKYETGKYGNILLDRYFKAVEELVNKAKIKGNRINAIEIGCGEGLSTARIAKFLPKNYVLDASEYVKRQIPYAKKNNPGIQIFQESIYELKHKDNSYDIVFLLEVMEHLDFPNKAFAELKRIIKPGGYLIIGVPREPLWRMFNFARGKYLRDLGNTPGHLNHWSTRGLKKLAQTHFGEVVAVEKPLPWTIVLTKKDEQN